MAKMTPKEAQEKHARRTKAAAEDMRKGIDRVTEAPGSKAAEKVDKMRTNLLAAIDDGTWQRRVAGFTVEQWRAAMKDKGVPRVAAGVDGAAEKVEEFFGQLFSHQDRLASKLEAMPDMTLEDNINRMVEWTRGMADFERE